jgi:hypothetical protein
VLLALRLRKTSENGVGGAVAITRDGERDLQGIGRAVCGFPVLSGTVRTCRWVPRGVVLRRR